jgi:DNA-binding Lrp family transcriptional regulator
MDKATMREVFSTAEFGAELPASEIAKKLGLSRQVVARSLQRMKSEQSVTFKVRRNPWKMGLNNYSIFFEYGRSGEKLLRLEKYLEQHPAIEYYGRAVGQYDAVAVVYARSVADITNFLREVEHRHPRVIERLSILTRLAVALFPHRMNSTRATSSSPLIYGIQDMSNEVDEADQKVLDALQRCREFNLRKCSRDSKIPIATLSRRVAGLRAKKVLLAFSFIPSIRLTGCATHRLLISTSHTDEVVRAYLLKLCEQELSITALISTVGSWNYEIEVACKHVSEIRQLCLTLKERLHGIIRSIEHLELVD